MPRLKIAKIVKVMLLLLNAPGAAAQPLQVRWSTYLGGGFQGSLGGDQLYEAQLSGHTLDPQGNIILAGSTSYTTLPVTANAFQRRVNGVSDLFVAKLTPAGQLLWLTYYGGSGIERFTGVHADTAGNVYLAGRTESADFPRTALTGTGGLIVSFDPNGGRRWALAGSGMQNVNQVTTDAAGDLVACGSAGTLSLGEGVLRLQTTFGGGASDGFVALFSPLGVPRYATYAGGTAADATTGCAVDGRGIVHAAHYRNEAAGVNWRLEGLDLVRGTRSYTTPLVLGRFGGPGPMTISNNTIWMGGAGGNGMTVTPDAAHPRFTNLIPLGTLPFLARFSTGGELQYSSYLGGNRSGNVNAIRLDDLGNVALCGSSSATDFPITADALEPSRTASGTPKAIFAIYRADGSQIYGTYINGLGDTFCNSLTLRQGNWVLSGIAPSLLTLVSTQSNNRTCTMAA